MSQAAPRGRDHDRARSLAAERLDGIAHARRAMAGRPPREVRTVRGRRGRVRRAATCSAASATTSLSRRATCGRGRPPRSRRRRLPRPGAPPSVRRPRDTAPLVGARSSRSSWGRAVRRVPAAGRTTKGPDPEATPFALAAGEIQVLSHNDDGRSSVQRVASTRCARSPPTAAAVQRPRQHQRREPRLQGPVDASCPPTAASSSSSARLRLERRVRPAAQDERTCGDRRAVGARHDRAAVRCDRDRHAARHHDGRRHQRITERRSGRLGLARRVAGRHRDPGVLGLGGGVPGRLVPAVRRADRVAAATPPASAEPTETRPTARSPPTRPPARLRPSRRRRRRASRSPRGPTARSRSRATS